MFNTDNEKERKKMSKDRHLPKIELNRLMSHKENHLQIFALLAVVYRYLGEI